VRTATAPRSRKAPTAVPLRGAYFLARARPVFPHTLRLRSPAWRSHGRPLFAAPGIHALRRCGPPLPTPRPRHPWAAVASGGRAKGSGDSRSIRRYGRGRPPSWRPVARGRQPPDPQATLPAAPSQQPHHNFRRRPGQAATNAPSPATRRSLPLWTRLASSPRVHSTRGHRGLLGGRPLRGRPPSSARPPHPGHLVSPS